MDIEDRSTRLAITFRSVMQAIAKPGRIETLTGEVPPAPLSVAAGAVLLTLADHDTPIHLAGKVECPDVESWIRFHCGAPIVGRSECMFAVGRWDDLAPLARYPLGSADYPDSSATLIVECAHVEARGVTLTGPGIREASALNLPERAAFQANHARFPCGLDFLFTAGDRVAALPRSTKIH